MKRTKLVRPVRCYFCNKPMFYSDDKRFVQEVSVEIRESGSNRQTMFFAHTTCWNRKIETQ